jgi:hypothetical protein
VLAEEAEREAKIIKKCIKKCLADCISSVVISIGNADTVAKLQKINKNTGDPIQFCYDRGPERGTKRLAGSQLLEDSIHKSNAALQAAAKAKAIEEARLQVEAKRLEEERIQEEQRLRNHAEGESKFEELAKYCALVGALDGLGWNWRVRGFESIEEYLEYQEYLDGDWWDISQMDADIEKFKALWEKRSKKLWFRTVYVHPTRVQIEEHAERIEELFQKRVRWAHLRHSDHCDLPLFPFAQINDGVMREKEEAEYDELRQRFQPAFNNTFDKVTPTNAKDVALKTEDLILKMGLTDNSRRNIARLNRYLGVPGATDAEFKKFTMIKYDFDFNGKFHASQTKHNDYTYKSNKLKWHCFKVK